MARIRKRAKRDVKAAYQPQFDAMNRAQGQIKTEARSDRKRIGNIYEALNQNLAPIQGQYDAAAQGIASGLQDQLGSLAGMLNMGSNAQGLAPGELQAAQGAFGQLGASGLQTLAGDRSRQAAWQGSTQRQAALENMTAHRNLLEDKRQLLDDLRNQRVDLKGEMAPAILAHIGELRDTRAQRRLAQQELELRQKLAEDQLNQHKKEYHNARSDQKDAKKYTISQVEEKHDRAKIAPIRKDIESLLDKIKTWENEQKDVGRPNAQLQKKENQARRQIKRKKKRIRRIKKTDSYS